MKVLHLLSGGAAQGLVERLRQDFLVDTGAEIHGTFGAVGAMRAKLVGGAPCDVLILTAAIIDALEAEGRLLRPTAPYSVEQRAVKTPGISAPPTESPKQTPAIASAVGSVRTGVAVRAGEAPPALADAASLRGAFVAASGIYIPDPQLATAGIHMIDVLRRLGIHDEVAARLRPFPNGATAMRELARSTEVRPVGCTQITEIRYAQGVTLVGPLPREFELSTVYVAAISAASSAPELARRFIERLTGPTGEQARAESGFE